MIRGEFESEEEQARHAGRRMSESSDPARQHREEGGMAFSVIICSAVMMVAAIAFLAA